MRRVAMLFWLSVFAAAPALAQAPAASLQMLERQLAATATENPGEYGIAAVDLANGDVVSVNGNVPFPMASTVKVAVAATYLSEVDAGRRSLDDQIGGVSAHDPDERDADPQRQSRHRSAADDARRAGDRRPLAARPQSAPGSGWTARSRSCSRDRRDLHDVRDSSTPMAMLRLLQLIDTGQALSPESRDRLLDMMSRCATGSNRIRALLPPGTQGRAQDRHAERLYRRRRLRHPARRPPDRDGAVRARRRQSPRRHRHRRPGHLRRLRRRDGPRRPRRPLPRFGADVELRPADAADARAGGPGGRTMRAPPNWLSW